MMGEERLHIAGVEIALHAPAPILAEYLPRIHGYASRGGAPALVHRYEAVPDYMAPAPIRREYPGYDCAAGVDGYHFRRQDSEGTIAIRGGAVESAFRGRAQWTMLEASLRVAFSIALSREGGLLLHSSGVVTDDGRAFVFTGVSGAGKTTIVRLLT